MSATSKLTDTPFPRGRTFLSVRWGAVNWTVLAWAVGVPIPLVLIIGLMRGCS